MNPVTVATYPVGNKMLEMLYQNETPYVKIDQHQFQSLQQLVEAVPQLNSQGQLETFVKIANFMASGFEFIIVNHATEVKSYDKESFGTFDISEVHSPRIENNEAIFYVQRRQNGVPYKVSAPWPYRTSPSMRYEVLPYSK